MPNAQNPLYLDRDYELMSYLLSLDEDNEDEDNEEYDDDDHD